MKLIPLIIAAFSAAPTTSSPMSTLELAIWQVESSQCVSDCRAGDNGKAIGPLQIHFGCWSDVRRGNEQYEDCEGLDYSVEVFRRYMKRYATKKRLGHVATYEDIARIWNGGPNGYKKESTVKYWWRVRKTIVRSHKEDQQ
jgi:hypothetical protein